MQCNAMHATVLYYTILYLYVQLCRLEETLEGAVHEASLGVALCGPHETK
jgi:hypothetical protein